MSEQAPIKSFHVWVTAAKDEFAEALVAKLVRRGFTVGPLGRQLITTHDDNPACVVALAVFRSPRNDQEREEYTAMGVHLEVVDVIKHVKGRFWSIVVAAMSDCTWNSGNASVKAELELTKKVN